MGEISGINRQREGQVSNRETVGGVERATLQSAHITEWLFVTHEDVKRRVLNCFVETAKIAFRGRSKKFEYITSDFSKKIMEVDGNAFAECDYGMVVDNGSGTQELMQKLDLLAQAALQNSTLSFSTIMKIYSSASLAEKQRMIEEDERAIQQRNEQAQQQQLQQQQQIAQMQENTKLQQLEMQDRQHAEDNETKILVAEINARAEAERFAMKFGEDDGIQEISADKKAELEEKIREFDEKMKLERNKLELENKKIATSKQVKNK
jgi:membrane protein involved in colicin uptake